MQKSILMAALTGIAVGVFWIKAPAAVFHSYAPLPSPWNAMMWASCPTIWAFQTPAWLVALLNGILYAAIALSIQFLRNFLRPFAR